MDKVRKGQLYKVNERYVYIAWQALLFYVPVVFNTLDEFKCFQIVFSDTYNGYDVNNIRTDMHPDAKLVDLTKLDDEAYISSL